MVTNIVPYFSQILMNISLINAIIVIKHDFSIHKRWKGIKHQALSWFLTSESMSGPGECLCMKNRLINLTHISPASFLWDIGKHSKTRSDATKRGV